MPIYEHRCNACNHITEVIAKYTDRDSPVDCEDCGSDDVDRQVSAVKGQQFRHYKKAARDARAANLSEV